MESRVKPEFKARKPMEHVLKIWPEFYGQIIHRQKQFEIRKDDRDYQNGDTLILREYLPQDEAYTGNQGKAYVRNVHRGIPGLKDGYCIMDILFIGVAVKEHDDPGNMNQ
jgi:hypothetical protein